MKTSKANNIIRNNFRRAKALIKILGGDFDVVGISIYSSSIMMHLENYDKELIKNLNILKFKFDYTKEYIVAQRGLYYVFL